MTNKVYQGCAHLFPIVFVQCIKNRSIVKQDSQNSKSLIPNRFKVDVKIGNFIVCDHLRLVSESALLSAYLFISKCLDPNVKTFECNA